MRAAATLLIHILTARTSLRFPRKRKARKSVVTRTLRSLSLSLAHSRSLSVSRSRSCSRLPFALFFISISLFLSCHSVCPLFVLSLFSHIRTHFLSLFPDVPTFGVRGGACARTRTRGHRRPISMYVHMCVRLRLTERRGRKETGGAGGGLLWSKDT